MHLSLLSAACLSDLLDEPATRANEHPSRQHLDGLRRGLCLAAALLVPVAMSCAATAVGHLDASHASATSAGRP